MNSKSIFALLTAAICLQFQISESAENQGDDFYSAAVVEYRPLFDSDEQKMLSKNFNKYKSIIETAAKQKMDIIVFPEGGLTKSVFTTVPDPSQMVNPCVPDSAELIRNLSCLAAENRIYVALNLLEKREIVDSAGQNKTARYNTNVVFNRNGVVVARYAKYNLFDEAGIDRPPEPEISIFDTDFGVRFGTFICFDILFDKPSLKLLKKYEVSDIIFTSQWFSELPFLTALQVQQGWAQANDVNLLASGYNNLLKGSSGSGIYHGSKGPLVLEIGGEEDHVLLTYSIPKISRKGTKKPLPPSFTISDSQDHFTNKSAFFDDGVSLQQDNFHLLSDQIELFDSLVIKPGFDFDGKICTNKNFCCGFSIRLDELNGNTKKDYIFRVVAFHGVRRFGLSFTGGVQACAVVFCNGPTISNCASRPFDLRGHYEFSRIKIEGIFNLENSMQFPTTLMGTNKLLPLSTLKYDFRVTDNQEEKTRKIQMSLKSSVYDLLTFGIWGRDFTLDGKPPSPPASKAPQLTSFLEFLLVSLVFFLLLGH